MRYIDGQVYYTVSEVAAAAGVSAQTVRLWERQGTVVGRRTQGGHRLFDAESLRKVQDRVTSRSRRGATPSPAESDVKVEPIADWELGSTGARIRAVRLQRGLSQRETATKADISRSMLSAVERGETGVSMFVFTKLADVLDIPISDLAPALPSGQRLVKADSRPRTVLAGGVTWEELATPGHVLSPAYLFVPPRADSGGYVTFAADHFVTVLEGELRFSFAGDDVDAAVTPGDGLTIAAGATHSWANPTDSQCVAIWIAHHPEHGAGV